MHMYAYIVQKIYVYFVEYIAKICIIYRTYISRLHILNIYVYIFKEICFKELESECEAGK